MHFALVLLIGIFSFAYGQRDEYIVAEPRITLLHPKGFTVSIPDDGEIKLFAFHGKINEEFDGREAGQFARDITAPRDGWWTFTDRNTRFRVGDIIYYWLYVINKNDNLGYLRENEQYTVTELPGPPGKDKNKNGHNNQNPVTSTTVRTTRTTTTTTTTPAPCNESPTRVNGGTTCAGKIIFEEEFNDFSRWQKEIRLSGEPDYEFVIFTNDNQVMYIQNNQLHIKPTASDVRYGKGFVKLPTLFDLGVNCTGTKEEECKQQAFSYNILPPALSGKIHTNSFSFLYGQIDIKAKLPKGNWIYPELYLTPKRYSYGPGYDSGEMRVAFILGNDGHRNKLQGGLILGDSGKGRTFAIKENPSQNNWSDDFHVYSLKWRPDGVTLLVDGNVYGNIYPPPGGFSAVFSSESNSGAANKWSQGDIMAPFDKEMVVTIGVGVGGHSIPDSIEGKPYRNQDVKEKLNFYKAQDLWLPTWQQANSELIVDYVKVYAL